MPKRPAPERIDGDVGHIVLVDDNANPVDRCRYFLTGYQVRRSLLGWVAHMPARYPDAAAIVANRPFRSWTRDGVARKIWDQYRRDCRSVGLYEHGNGRRPGRMHLFGRPWHGDIAGQRDCHHGVFADAA